MKTFAEFQIIGRVGKIRNVNGVLHISLAAEYGRKNKDGEFQSNPVWNDVPIFNENTVRWVSENVATGDLVHARGTIRDTRYEKDGQTVYGVTLAAREFDLLAKKQERDEDQD